MLTKTKERKMVPATVPVTTYQDNHDKVNVRLTFDKDDKFKTSVSRAMTYSGLSRMDEANAMMISEEFIAQSRRPKYKTNISAGTGKIRGSYLKEQEERLLKLAYNSVRKRVADSLMMLYKKYKHEDVRRFSMAISREDLASIVGTATESVIRVLSDFKSEGLVEIKGSQITVLDAEKLSRMRN
ncbi:MAG: helix-turn-helix domain-containing protein [Chitinophagaceae bacterium]|nr:MAG: helix-turn-helix domain-containing protein [Chitinophagaceae bacterium]